MKRTFILLATISLCASASVFNQLMDVIKTQPVKTQFKLWHFAMQRPYDINSEVALQKYRTFKANLKYIEDKNKSQNDYQLGLGPFTDLSWEEFEKNYLSVPKIEELKFVHKQDFDFDDVADDDDGYFPNEKFETIDWRYVHPTVKDQKSCSSCWAFATVAVLEAQLILKNSNYSLLSEQELVDCSDNLPGCKGGWYHYSFGYVQKNGLTLGTNYPYVAENRDFIRPCEADHLPRVIKGFKKLYSCAHASYAFTSPKVCTPPKIRSHMLNGPVATLIHAFREMQHYRQGQWYPDFCKFVNHAIELVYVNYDPVTQTGLSVIRNSWGPYWGVNGIGEVKIGPNQGLLGCGTLEFSFIALDLLL